MATSVKMDDETKSRLEALQAAIKLETGRKVTQQELLAELVRRGDMDRDELIDAFRETDLPLSDEQRERFHAVQFSSGVETTEEDIDEILYGWEKDG
jgi:protein-disulfide isomerase-like protein with CxxC motif